MIIIMSHADAVQHFLDSETFEQPAAGRAVLLYACPAAAAAGASDTRRGARARPARTPHQPADPAHQQPRRLRRRAALRARGTREAPARQARAAREVAAGAHARGPLDGASYNAQVRRNGGFIGPWLNSTRF